MVDLMRLKAFEKVRCPICGKKMKDAYDARRGIGIWFCHCSKIAIAKTDPCVNKWYSTKREKVPCPNCNADMRVFFTSTGFFLAKCPKPKCRCEVRSTPVKDMEKKTEGRA